MASAIAAPTYFLFWPLFRKSLIFLEKSESSSSLWLCLSSWFSYSFSWSCLSSVFFCSLFFSSNPNICFQLFFSPSCLSSLTLWLFSSSCLSSLTFWFFSSLCLFSSIGSAVYSAYLVTFLDGFYSSYKVIVSSFSSFPWVTMIIKLFNIFTHIHLLPSSPWPAFFLDLLLNFSKPFCCIKNLFQALSKREYELNTFRSILFPIILIMIDLWEGESQTRAQPDVVRCKIFLLQRKNISYTSW